MSDNSVIQMYDSTREYLIYKDKIDFAINETVCKGDFINGTKVKELEIKLQTYTNAKHAITCANGTDAIFIALKALNIGAGDEVITVALTWISSAETISMTGAKPIWVDVRKETFCINEDLIEQAITKKTKAMVIVSLYGYMPNYEHIMEIANKYNIAVIEDGAQSFGAENNYKSCSNKFTHISTTSFFPTKPLGCYGDGGCIFTNDDDLAEILRSIKSHGSLERFKHKYIGVNSRLDTIQASILLTKLTWFNKSLLLRDSCAQAYEERLRFNTRLVLPKNNINIHSWAQYSILADSEEHRNNIVDALKNNGVNTSIFYPIPLYKQECFNESPNIFLPITEEICKTIFNLPCYSYITIYECDKICEIINCV